MTPAKRTTLRELAVRAMARPAPMGPMCTCSNCTDKHEERIAARNAILPLLDDCDRLEQQNEMLRDRVAFVRDTLDVLFDDCDRLERACDEARRIARSYTQEICDRTDRLRALEKRHASLADAVKGFICVYSDCNHTGEQMTDAIRVVFAALEQAGAGGKEPTG